jgi:hypothetical protein
LFSVSVSEASLWDTSPLPSVTHGPAVRKDNWPQVHGRRGAGGGKSDGNRVALTSLKSHFKAKKMMASGKGTSDW